MVVVSLLAFSFNPRQMGLRVEVFTVVADASEVVTVVADVNASKVVEHLVFVDLVSS